MKPPKPKSVPSSKTTDAPKRRRQPLDLKPGCFDAIRGLPKEIRKQVGQCVNDLRYDPFPHTSKALSGVVDADGYPVRREVSGDYRILYVVRGSTLRILNADNRRQVYRNLSALKKSSPRP